MKSRKIVKIITVLLIIATIFSAVNMVFGLSDLSTMPSADGGSVGTISGPVQKIMGVTQYICYAAAVILLIMLGVKFMTGSPDSAAEVKKSAVIYVIGAVLVFAAGVILGVISKFGASTLQ